MAGGSGEDKEVVLPCGNTQQSELLMRKGFTGRTAQEALKNRHDKLCSWREVSRRLDNINPGMLSAIANGKKKAPPSVLKALELPITVRVEQVICQKCNELHPALKKCNRNKSSNGKRHNWKNLSLLLASLLIRKDYNP